MNRRDFIKTSAMAGAAAALYGGFGPARAWAFYQSSGLGLTLFGQPLRGVGPEGIPVALPDAFAAPITGVTHYSLNIGQFTDKLHPNLGPTTLWGYSPAVALGEGGYPTRHLGGIIVAQKGVPIQLTFTNHLPNKAIIPIDESSFFPDAASTKNKTAVHLHGGFVPWISDGGPFEWFDGQGNVGPSVPLANAPFSIFKVLNPNILGNQGEYYYPNDQSARLVWYHDHAHDITRTNAYSGIASAYIIRDAFELNLQNQGLPGYVEAGGREIPLVVQDKIFVNGATIGTMDPTWPSYCPNTTGSLWYAHTYEAARWGPIPKGALPIPDPSCIPEYFGDTMLMNGTVCPEATVEARRYRIRFLNACSARFLNLQLYVDDGSANGITLDPKTGNPLNPPFLNSAALNPQGKPTSNWMVLGSEGGFLPKPTFVPSNMPFGGVGIGSLFAAPAERYDLLLDFSGYAGKNIILYTDAPAPFPVGDPRNDYFPGLNVKGNPVNGTTTPGEAPNTRILMRFKVTAATGVDAPLAITRATSLTAGNDPLFVPPGVTTPPPGVPIRPLTLNETFDAWGRLIQLLGTNVVQPGGTFGQPLANTPTETPTAGSTEVWQIANLTGDTHPIHFHLVNVQIISRQKFSVSSYNGMPNFQSAPMPPAPEESGWKETVRMNPGEVTTVIMQFKLPANPPGVSSIPTSPRTGGYEYVWHCHILEHEEHDMMRPLVVL
jgi:spore coat protein A